MKYIERMFPWVLLSPVILPVVVWGWLIYPYLVPKTLFFYAISLVAFGMFAILIAHGRSFFWARLSTWEALVPGALVVLAYAASFYGIDFYRSFWSTFERGDGLLMLTCSVASFYMILITVERKFFDMLLRAVAIAGSISAIYGIGEWVIDHSRIGSLFGNAALFAGYLGIAFFVTLAAAQSLPKNWRRAAYGGAALQLIAIVLTATRGTMLALAVAGVAYLVYISFLKLSVPKQKNGVRLGLASRSAPFFGLGIDGSIWARALLAALVVFGALFFVFRADLAKVRFAPISRVASIGTSDPDVANRLFVWKNMLTEIEKSPVLGVGAEHIDVLFNKFYDPTQISEQWFDRSHNAFLDYAAQYGIGGLLLYIALISSFFTTAFRFARRDSSVVAGIFSLLAITYTVQNFFVFDTVSSFWLMLALLAAFLSISVAGTHSKPVALPMWARNASWLFAFALVALIIPVSVRPALAAYNLSQAYTYQIVDPARSESYMSRGIALGTYGDAEYGYEAYDMYVGTQAAALSGRASVDAYHSAFAALSTSFDKYPYDARTALYLAHVLTLAPKGVTPDYGLLSSALTRTITESPKRMEAWFMLVNLSIGEANMHPESSPERIAGYTAARDLMSKYVSLVPNLAEPHFVLAQLMFASSDPTGAASEAAKGKAVYTPDIRTAMRAAAYYETVRDLPDAEFFLKEVVRLNPSDSSAASDLFKIQSYEQSKK